MSSKPLVGFFPRFYGMGESYPIIKIAQYYNKIGGKVVFFSHGGDYEYIVRDLGFEIIKIKPFTRKTSKFFREKNEDEIIKVIRKEAQIYQDSGIHSLLQTNVFFGCILASRLARIPLISVVSGSWTPQYFYNNLSGFPDEYENYLTYFIPKTIKKYFYNWYMRNYKDNITKKFNNISKKLELDLYFPSKNHLLLGDYTLISDNIDFLGLNPSQSLPKDNFIGPILPDTGSKILDKDIINHLQRPGKKILLTMGTGPPLKESFLKILKYLDKTDYNVIATYTTVLKKNELPKLRENILLKKFVKNISYLNKIVDLAVIHGGRGTVYTAAYSSKPFIGIPYMIEQQNNLENLQKHRSGIFLSRKYLTEKIFLKALNKIIKNYDFFHKNAKLLSEKLPRPEGDVRAVERILKIMNQDTDRK